MTGQSAGGGSDAELHRLPRSADTRFNRVRGQGLHTLNEHIEVDSLVEPAQSWQQGPIAVWRLIIPNKGA